RETRSTGCSTTQIVVWPRRASAQIEQSSSSVRLPHSAQKRTRSFTSSIAPASASASSFGRERRWNASRCAVRWPTPGSFVSCATRLSTDGDSTVTFCPQPSAGAPTGRVPSQNGRGCADLGTGGPERLEAQTHRAEIAEVQLRLGEVLGGLEGRVHRCEHEILERLRVIG